MHYQRPYILFSGKQSIDQKEEDILKIGKSIQSLHFNGDKVFLQVDIGLSVEKTSVGTLRPCKEDLSVGVHLGGFVVFEDISQVVQNGNTILCFYVGVMDGLFQQCLVSFVGRPGFSSSLRMDSSTAMMSFILEGSGRD